MVVKIIVPSYPQYTFVKDNIFYFQKTIPVDLKYPYTSKRISFSLRTRSSRNAEAAAKVIVSKLHAYWLSLGLTTLNLPAALLLKPIHTVALSSGAPALTESTEDNQRTEHE